MFQSKVYRNELHVIINIISEKNISKNDIQINIAQTVNECILRREQELSIKILKYLNFFLPCIKYQHM